MPKGDTRTTYIHLYMGNCQNYGPFLGPYYNTGPNLGDPKRDHNFDNPPYGFKPKASGCKNQELCRPEEAL